MDVDQTRRNDQSIDIHRPLSRLRIEVADGSNDPILNANVSDSIDRVTRVDNAAPRRSKSRLTATRTQKKNASRSNWVRETALPPSVLSRIAPRIPSSQASRRV